MTVTCGRRSHPPEKFVRPQNRGILQGTNSRGFCEPPASRMLSSASSPTDLRLSVYKERYPCCRTPLASGFSLLPIFIPYMAPFFIRNLVPRRQARDADRRPLSEVLLSLTGIQWAQFLTGYDHSYSCPFLQKLTLALDGLPGPATQSTFSMLLSASRACKNNSTKLRLLPSCVTIKFLTRHL